MSRTLMTMVDRLTPDSNRTEAVLEHEVPSAGSVPFVVTFAEALCGIFWISESTGPCHAKCGFDSSTTCKPVSVLHVPSTNELSILSWMVLVVSTAGIEAESYARQFDNQTSTPSVGTPLRAKRSTHQRYGSPCHHETVMQ